LEPKASALATPSQDYEHYFFNLGTKATSGVDGPVFFQDANVRKAFIMCIDRDTIAQKLLFGQTKVIATLWPNSQWENTSLKPYPFDVQAAGKLLDAAGWAIGDDGVRAKDINGKRVRLSFAHSTTTGNQLRADVQVFATSTLRQCGMELLPQNYPSGPLFGTFAQDGVLSTGKYDTGGFTTSFTPDPDPVDTFLCSGVPTREHPNGNNWYRLCDPELEKLSNDQAKEPDQAKRKAIFDQMQQLMYDKAYVVPLYNRLKVAGVAARVQGLKISPIGDIYWSAYDWSVK
jgi:peptide/nickel transport system substrate-binding protein